MELCKIILPVIGTFAFGMLLTLFMHIVDERKIHMWFTKKKEDEVMEAVDKVNESIQAEEFKPEPVDEWIWVEGYKATEKDMKCRDYQYELGTQHDMPDETEIKECEQGFHLCKTLSDVFRYYEVCDGHRFFKVRALVRKSHYERYGKETEEYKEHRKSHHTYFHTFWGSKVYDKMVAKSIILEQELTVDEIIESRYDYVKTWPDKYKNLVLQVGIDNATEVLKVDKLVEVGFSETFARYITRQDMYERALSVGSQPDLSMDMKCWLIFK